MKPTNLIHPITGLPSRLVNLQARSPREHDPRGPNEHGHRPLLPWDRRSAGEALSAAVSSLLARPVAITRRLAALFTLWLWRYQSRTRIAELSDQMLRDIGLTRADAWRESSKPFWRD